MISYENTSTKVAWGSRRMYIIALLSQTLGVNTIVFLPHQAVTWGAAGQSIVFILIYIVLGIPMLYMENVVGQFTGRDCLEVWHARACLSHLGYLHIVWQLVFGIYLHTVNSFTVHYFLISFENPIPYYVCGRWSKPDCDILNYNYSVNQDCLKLKDPLPYCSDLCHTFPEYQYWRFNILALDKEYFMIPWRVGLASGLVCIVVFLSCFKRMRSLKWMLLFVTLFPMSARFIFMIGSMLQKGLVVKYEEALDSDFSTFIQEFSLSNSIAEVLFSLNVGTGLAIGSSSKTSFRSPCYSNTVIVVIITCAVTILGVCSTAMMSCPYAFKYDIKPAIIMRYPIANVFEKIPRLIHVYESTSLWLILSFSFTAVSALGLNICIISGILEIMAKRSFKVSRNPGLVSFVVTILLYVFTAPLLGNLSLYFFVDIKRAINMLIIFMVMVETFVFVLWYGLEKFSEDVHFMQGVQPKASVKACWLISGVVLVYVFFTQLYVLYEERDNSMGKYVSWWMLISIILLSVIVTIIKLLMALYKKKLYEQICLQSTWGPKSEILKRSRAMFTAQAMTKEYMYRQYHLQAGILMRQKGSNIRSCYKFTWNQRPDKTQQNI